MTLRTPQTQQLYEDAKVFDVLNDLKDEPRIAGTPHFKYWRIIDNRFPYDLHHELHHMAVLKRDARFSEMLDRELDELWHQILPWASYQYDYWKMNFPHMQSKPLTPHVHLMVLKAEYK